MKRWLPLLTLITFACVLPTLTQETQKPETQTTEVKALTITPSIILQPTFTPTPQQTVTPTPIIIPGLAPDSISVYPTDLFPNDYYSIDVAPQIPSEITEMMTLTVSFPDGTSLQQNIEPSGLDGKQRARFPWVKQVPDIASPITLKFALEIPTGLSTNTTQTVSLTTYVNVLPPDLLPPPEPDASWTLTRTAGFEVHYVTGTKAERDLEVIIAEANQAYTDITENLGDYQGDIDIYILDRVIGQGGYASQEWVAVSYPDRGYSPIGLVTLLKHELTHLLDDEIGCSEAPAVVREGLAVYLAGGHYREESIIVKASTALSFGYMTPLTRLLNDFYIQQHEIAYLEAAAFVAYVEKQYGWNGIKALCEISSSTEGADLDKLEAAAQEIAEVDASELFTQYRVWLGQQPVQQLDQELFEHELKLMELMRQYQLTYDPAAHFLEGILFSPEQGERQDIVADFVRGRISDEAIAIELFLTAGQDAVVRQDVHFLKTILSILEKILIEGNKDLKVFDEVIQIVNYTRNLGYEPFNLEFLGASQYELGVLNLSNWRQTFVIRIRWLNDRWIIVGGE